MQYEISTKILKEEKERSKEDVTDTFNDKDDAIELTDNDEGSSEWKWEIGDSWFASLSYKSGNHVITDTNFLENFNKGDIIESVNGECFTGCPSHKLADILKTVAETDLKLKVISKRNSFNTKKIILCRINSVQNCKLVSPNLKQCDPQTFWVQLDGKNGLFLTMKNKEFVFEVSQQQKYDELYFEVIEYEILCNGEKLPKCVTLKHIVTNQIIAVKKDENTDEPCLYAGEIKNELELAKSYQSLFERQCSRHKCNKLESVFCKGEAFKSDSAQQYFLAADGKRLVLKSKGDYFKFRHKDLPEGMSEIKQSNDIPRKKYKCPLNCIVGHEHE